MKHARNSLVICDHLPHKDPRVVWHIMSLREECNVDVLYLNRTNEPMPPNQVVEDVKYFEVTYSTNVPEPKGTEKSATIAANFPRRPPIPQRPMTPQRPTIPQRAYAIKKSISSPILYRMYNCVYIPAKLAYRFIISLKAHLKAHLKAQLEALPKSMERYVDNLRMKGKIRKKLNARPFPKTVFWFRVLLGDLKMMRGTFRSLRNEAHHIKKSYDVIVASDLPVLEMGVYIKKICGGILIYDAHENWSQVRPGTPGICAAITELFERRLARSADIVTTVSPLLVEHLRQSLRNKNVLLLPNAAPLAQAALDKDPRDSERSAERFAGEIAGLAQGRLAGIFLGGVAPERGLKELVSAWGSIPEDEAILIIRAPEGRNEELDRVIAIAVANRTFNKTVFILSSVPEDQLIPAASGADVGIIPYRPTFDNHTMACPNKLSQYMQAGVAILTNAIPYPKHIVEEANCGLSYSDHHGYGEIVDRIMYLRRNKQRLDEFKFNAKKYCRSHYNWDIFYKNLATEIDRIGVTESIN